MIIICNDDDLLEAIEYANFIGKYKKLKSASSFRLNLKKTINLMRNSRDINELKLNGSLHYERLKYELNGYSSVRIGYKTKYRLILKELESSIEIEAIEISEHYGDK